MVQVYMGIELVHVIAQLLICNLSMLDPFRVRVQVSNEFGKVNDAAQQV